MKIGLRHVSAAAIVWLRSALAAGGQTRASLARELCRRENWRNPKGDLCLASARVALPRIASELDLPLPPSRGAPGRRPAPRDYPDLAVACSLGDLGEVEVTPQAAGEAPLARAMLATWHPEGEARTPGARVSYWIHSPRLGRLGLLVFSAAGWHQKARDTFIGWSQSARDAHLDKLVVNDRFLLLPSVRVEGLASHVLALAVRRLPGDWQAKYGVRPLLAYTYVAPEHAGTSYLAAGWQCCPQRTSGRTGVRRSVWMKPLADDWRDVLCREPEVRPGTRPAPAGDADWAEREYGRGRFSDVRVGKRVVMMGRAWNDRPGAPLPVIFPGEAEQRPCELPGRAGAARRADGRRRTPPADGTAPGQSVDGGRHTGSLEGRTNQRPCLVRCARGSARRSDTLADPAPDDQRRARCALARTGARLWSVAVRSGGYGCRDAQGTRGADGG